MGDGWLDTLLVVWMNAWCKAKMIDGSMDCCLDG